MLTGIFAGWAGNVVLGWVGRRVLEVGGWLAALIPFFMTMPPEHQATVLDILQGDGGSLSIMTYIGLAGYVFSQIASYRATVRPQVVTSTKKKVNVPVLTEEQAKDLVERQTGRRPTLRR